MNFFPKLTPNETVFGLIYYLLQLMVIPSILAVINGMLPVSISEALINVIFFAINFVAVLVIFQKFLIANFRVLRVYPWHVLRFAGIGLVIYMVGNAVFTLLTTMLSPEFANINDTAIAEMVSSHFGLMTLGTVILVPIAEESFYRGLIFRNVYDRHPVLAYIISMVLFSLAHVIGYVTLADFDTLVLCFIQYLPAGFALAWSYRKSGSIFAPVLIHMVVNQTGMLLMR